MSAPTPTGLTETPRPSAPLGVQARRVVEWRYARKDADGRAVERWPDVCRRVAGHVAAAEPDARSRARCERAELEVRSAFDDL